MSLRLARDPASRSILAKKNKNYALLRHPMKRFLLLILMLSTVLAQEYYADVEIEIDETGLASISGSSNHPLLGGQTDAFTSKRGTHWLFNLTLEEFSDYYLSVQFPEGAEINYMKVQGSFRIVPGQRIKVISTGESEKMELVAQYTIKREDSFPVVIVILALLAAAVAAWSGRKLFLRAWIPRQKMAAVRSTLTDAQRLIVDSLIAAKSPITQKQLQHRTKLPKATLSRNIEILHQKNIIEKQSRGLMNMIWLKK